MEKGNFKFSTVSSKDNKLKISFKIHLNNTDNNSPIQLTINNVFMVDMIPELQFLISIPTLVFLFF